MTAKTIDEFISCIATDEMVCPHCGKEQSDSWEVEGDSGEFECIECEKVFFYRRYYDVTYNTSKEEANV